MEKLAAIVMGNLETMSAQVLHRMGTDEDPSRVTEELAENVVIFDAPAVEDVDMEEKLQPSTLEQVVEDENIRQADSLPVNKDTENAIDEEKDHSPSPKIVAKRKKRAPTGRIAKERRGCVGNKTIAEESTAVDKALADYFQAAIQPLSIEEQRKLLATPLEDFSKCLKGLIVDN